MSIFADQNVKGTFIFVAGIRVNVDQMRLVIATPSVGEGFEGRGRGYGRVVEAAVERGGEVSGGEELEKADFGGRGVEGDGVVGKFWVSCLWWWWRC